MPVPPIIVALVGNPNAGKSTLFNALSGLRQHVGNYPGVTVEMKKGDFVVDGRRVELIDLPGTYSLAARSPDEMVAVDLLLGRQPSEPRPDLIVSVVDASNLERNLYLTTQLMELGVPVMVSKTGSERMRTVNDWGGEGLRIVRTPCDTVALAKSPELPKSIYEEGETLFGTAERDALVDMALTLGAQPEFGPQPPTISYGLALTRFNRIEARSSLAANASKQVRKKVRNRPFAGSKSSNQVFSSALAKNPCTKSCASSADRRRLSRKCA